MNSPVVWQRSRRDSYALRLDSAWSGELRVRVPAPGVRRLCRGATCLHGPVLAICSWQAQGIDPRPAPAAGGETDAWLQGERVVAVYGPGPANPMRFELRWQPGDDPPGVELEVSVATSLVPALRAFEVFTCGRAPRGQILVPLREGESVRWLDAEQWARTQHKSWAMACCPGRGRELARLGHWPVPARSAELGELALPVLLYRPPETDWSYAEVARASEATRAIFSFRNRRLRWGLGLFGQDFEKGVILRTSLRSAIVDRSNDTQEVERLARSWQERIPSLGA